MSLTSALTSARNALSVRSAETEVVSRNVAGVNEIGYTLKRANVATDSAGSVRLPERRLALLGQHGFHHHLGDESLETALGLVGRGVRFDDARAGRRREEPRLGGRRPVARRRRLGPSEKRREIAARRFGQALLDGRDPDRIGGVGDIENDVRNR